MEFAALVLLFVTTNLWGLYGEVPFTAIQPSRPFWDRAIGSFQLASTIHTLDQIYPYVLGKAPVELASQESTPDNAREQAMAAYIASRNVSFIFTPETATCPDQPTTVMPPVLPTAPLSDYRPVRKPRAEGKKSEDAVFENAVLVLLVAILAVLVKDVTGRSDRTQDTRLLRRELLDFIVRQDAFNDAIFRRLEHLHDCAFQLAQAGNGLFELQQRLVTDVTSVILSHVSSELGNFDSRLVQHFDQIRDNLHQNLQVWIDLAAVLRDFPAAVTNALATAIATEIVESRTRADRDTPRPGLDGSKWAGRE
ncbi:hypothetical protein NUU61_005025 [Penicillium alfredii]|uniref:Uncharacterized protein n=1 Tax=Penicillium alfredii TaxID=1506179 RepID=A0A9W9K778_9EURO|nr:uncharacterized protein NUU61_005025 [Penicillium alfredii]KAJ5095669.1 hypothetical protein NUU61_005025 [Penicillium alfredii]